MQIKEWVEPKGVTINMTFEEATHLLCSIDVAVNNSKDPKYCSMHAPDLINFRNLLYNMNLYKNNFT